MTTPFATIAVVPASPTQHIADADRLLISAVAQGAEHGACNGMRAGIRSVRIGGQGPVQIEVVTRGHQPAG